MRKTFPKAHSVKLGILLQQEFVFFQTSVPQTSFMLYAVAQTPAKKKKLCKNRCFFFFSHLLGKKIIIITSWIETAVVGKESRPGTPSPLGSQLGSLRTRRAGNSHRRAASRKQNRRRQTRSPRLFDTVADAREDPEFAGDLSIRRTGPWNPAPRQGLLGRAGPRQSQNPAIFLTPVHVGVGDVLLIVPLETQGGPSVPAPGLLPLRV